MIITVDVGGTKTLVASFSPGGDKIDSIKFPTPKEYPEFLQQLNEAIGKIYSSMVTCIAIALPGLLDRETGTVLRMGNLTWENVPIRDELRKNYDVPVLLDNDANLAGLAEANLLSKEEYPFVFYITVSTGIGTGAIVDHKISKQLEDSEGGAMHFLHNGELMKWEHFASGKAIVANYGKFASDINDAATWKKISANLAIGMANIVALLQPDAIVIGGGVGTHFEKFEKPLKKQMQAIAQNSRTIKAKMPLIQKAQNPEEAVIYGCYILAKQEGYATTDS